MNCRDLEIWQLGRELVIDIQKMIFRQLYDSLHARLGTLGKKTNRLIDMVGREHLKTRSAEFHGLARG